MITVRLAEIYLLVDPIEGSVSTDRSMCPSGHHVAEMKVSLSCRAEQGVWWQRHAVGETDGQRETK